jgi:hypothetical protein
MTIMITPATINKESSSSDTATKGKEGFTTTTQTTFTNTGKYTFGIVSSKMTLEIEKKNYSRSDV